MNHNLTSFDMCSHDTLRVAIPGSAIRLVEGWPPAGRRVVGAEQDLGYTFQNESPFRRILCHGATRRNSEWVLVWPETFSHRDDGQKWVENGMRLRRCFDCLARSSCAVGPVGGHPWTDLLAGLRVTTCVMTQQILKWLWIVFHQFYVIPKSTDSGPAW